MRVHGTRGWQLWRRRGASQLAFTLLFEAFAVQVLKPARRRSRSSRFCAGSNEGRRRKRLVADQALNIQALKEVT